MAKMIMKPKAKNPTKSILNSLFQPARKNNGISKGYDHQYPLTGKEEKVQMTDFKLSVFTLINENKIRIKMNPIH